MEGLFQNLASLAASAVLVGLTYLGAKKLGLTDMQKAGRLEVDRLVSALKDRMAVLEAENRDLKETVRLLTESKIKQDLRIATLEDIIRRNLRSTLDASS